MLRPEQMSKVSVAGSRRMLQDVIEAVHDLRMIHLSEYDGEIDGFEPGSSLSGSEEASDLLVTIRSLKSILDIDEDDAGPRRIVMDEAVEEQLEDLRTTVNELDDRITDLESEKQSVAEQIESVRPFVELGIDIDLLQDYETLEVAVGEANPDAVTAALEDEEDIAAFDVFGEDVLAMFAHPVEDASNVLDSGLVGVDFDRLEIPDASGDPETYLEDLQESKAEIETRLEETAAELESVGEENAGFLLAADEAYSIEVQKTEAPLNFATTDHAFVAEGWIPADTWSEFESTLEEEAGGRVAIDKLEVADYEEYAAAGHHEDGNGHDENGNETEADDSAENTPEAVAAGTVNGASADEDAEEEVVSDGGTVEFEADEEPPVILENPNLASPFELLVNVINRPKYWEIDPSMAILLTFPAFFGFMIGDVGYGLVYAGIGYWMLSSLDSDALKSLGGIAIWAGAFTVLFGILYGEIFGLHVLGEVVWGGHPPMHKGLQPKYAAYAQAWLIITLFVALAHLTLGFLFGFINTLPHGIKEAMLEKGSWTFLMLGTWVWIFSQHAAGAKPDLLYAVFNEAGATLPSGGTIAPEQVAYSLGFAGLPESVGIAGLALLAVGLVLLILGEGGLGILESLNVLVNVLSYTRIAAVLLAKAGMAFVVNLLFFGGYQTAEGAYHFYGLTSQHASAHGTELFSGLVHMGPAGWLGGVVVLVFGHLLVLALGITSAGLQAVRLEYVEFFGKFYEGGGETYDPFGYKRKYTTED